MKQRLTLRDGVADTNRKDKSGGGVSRCPGQFGQPRQTPVVDGGDLPGGVCRHRAGLRRIGRLPQAALRLADGGESGPGATVGQNRPRKIGTGAGRRRPAGFKQNRRQGQSALGQVQRRFGLAAQDGKNVPRLRGWADAAPDRLASVGQ